MPRIIVFILFSTFSFSQTRIITGVVSDNSNVGLESANIFAKPLQENARLKFAVANDKGQYRLELDYHVRYEITVSYIGYFGEVLIVEADSGSDMHDFKLRPTGVNLKEIIIKNDFRPVIVKEDTLTFDVNSFSNGNERKLKEILEKLPGVEVDKKGNVTVQGKKVTKMLVEGKSFFGGGSKLAVENIPADVLDKIEVIDHFNEVGFMKQVSDSDDLAMNIKLKKDRKSFVFGDLEAAAGNNKYYRAHEALFYYSPNSNVSFISDANNIGKSTFTFQDLIRFGGGASSYLTGRKSMSDLYSFANDNTDVLRNNSQFAAANFNIEVSKKLLISGFAVASKIFTASRIESRNDYLQNGEITSENSFTNSGDHSVLAMGNFKLDFSPDKNQKLIYNAQFQSGANNMTTAINSVTNLDSNLFESIGKADDLSLKQYFEWHKSYNPHHTATFVANQSYGTSAPNNEWFSNAPFLSGLIPLQNDANYTIRQIKEMQENTIDALLKHYWIINNNNHLYGGIGNNFGKSSFKTSEKQLLTNGTINDFSTSGFGNDVRYQLNDAYAGLEYKFKAGKWTNKPGLYWHWYYLSSKQPDADYQFSKTLFQPQWNSDYEFSKSESLSFAYKLTNEFPDVNQFANRYTLTDYNLVFKGNALLRNERFHAASLRYTKMSIYRGITWNAFAALNKKVRTVRDEIILDGINQYNSPNLSDNPETTWRFNGSVAKKIYRFTLKLNSSLNWFNYIQTLNSVTTENERNGQNIGLTLKTSYKKWPDFSIGYNKGYSQFHGLTSINYQSDAFDADCEVTFLQAWTFYADYENLKNTNTGNQHNYYDIANASLRYQKKNSPFGFEFSVNNLLDNNEKSSYSLSDYIISERMTYILPRIFLFSLSYKL
jgi:hypothetical protein